MERQALTHSGLPVKALLNYWSETTGECHCFPIFKTDMPIDIVHRYSDVFPMEYSNMVEEVKDANASLYNDNAMSKERLNMAKLKVPLLLYRALKELDVDFWEKSGVKWMERNIKPLKVGNRG